MGKKMLLAVGGLLAILGLVGVFVYLEKAELNKSFQSPSVTNSTLPRQKATPTSTQETDTHEQELIEVLKGWDGYKYKPFKSHSYGEIDEESCIQAHRVSAAMFALAKMKSTKAIPVLLDMDFSQTQMFFSLGKMSAMGENLGGLPLRVRHPTIVALRQIGPAVAEPVSRRLSELDEESHGSKVYKLWQVLLGVMERKDAVALLEKQAKETRDDKVRKRLQFSAKKLATLRMEK